MAADLSDVGEELRPAVRAALEAAGIEDGHLAVEIVDAERIGALNREHRGIDAPTDVLSFPLDEGGAAVGPRELGDVIVCPEYCRDMSLVEATVHGVLHLCGYDHESDDGEMLALQEKILTGLRNPPAMPGREAEDMAEPDSALTGPRSQSVSSGERGERSGFVGLAGRPNVGKSTLVNAIVGRHVAIVSVRPQTTRRAIRGISTDLDSGCQLVLVDLPGVQRPRDELTERMQRRVERELDDSDVALLVINGEEGVGPGDRFIARALLGAGGAPATICVVNKVDRIGPNELVPVLAEAAELDGVDEVFPISARSGEGLDALVQRLGELVPAGQYMYPPEELSDQSSELLLAELIREQVLNRTRDEIPHSVEVSVGEVAEREDGITLVKAEIWAETESQKGILIGKGGRKVEEIGSAARRSLEAEIGGRVHLDLKVRARGRWRRDGDLLDRLGIE